MLADLNVIVLSSWLIRHSMSYNCCQIGIRLKNGDAIIGWLFDVSFDSCSSGRFDSANLSFLRIISNTSFVAGSLHDKMFLYLQYLEIWRMSYSFDILLITTLLIFCLGLSEHVYWITVSFLSFCYVFVWRLLRSNTDSLYLQTDRLASALRNVSAISLLENVNRTEMCSLWK